ncbi:MAG: hypothetical protein GXP55_17785 [Deltaproteobacteria bacterium]|nr:hypothetical protein [Deltaproteobacteria bacterium]
MIGKDETSAQTSWRKRGPDLLFWALFACLSLLNLWPFWVMHWLAGTDTGGHIELMDIAGRLHDAHTAYGETYYLSSWMAPNTLGVRLSQALHPWVSSMTLARLMLSFYVVGVPLGCLAMVRAFDRSRWLVLLSFPLVFNFTLAMGFFNYVVAAPLLFFVVALTRRFAERGGWRRGAGVVALLWLTFFTHALMFMVALGMCAFVLLVSARPRRRLLQGVGLLSLGTTFCVVWLVMKIGWLGSEAGLMHHATPGTTWPNPEHLLTKLPGRLVDFVRGPTDDALFLGLVAVWALLLRASPPRPEDAEPAPLGFRLRLGRDALPWMAFLVWVAFFTLPSHVMGISLVSERFGSLALLLALLTPRVRLDGYWTRGLLAAGVVLSMAWVGVVDHALIHFDAYTAQPLARELGKLPEGSSIGYALANDLPTRLAQPQTRHLVKEIHTVLNGGVTDDSFAWRSTSPVQYRSGRAPPRPFGRFWTRKTQFRRYDFIVYSGRVPPPHNSLRGFVRERWHSGPWWLYEVLHPEPPSAVRRPADAGHQGQAVPAPALDSPVRALRFRLGQSPTTNMANRPQPSSHDAGTSSMGR